MPRVHKCYSQILSSVGWYVKREGAYITTFEFVSNLKETKRKLPVTPTALQDQQNSAVANITQSVFTVTLVYEGDAILRIL